MAKKLVELSFTDIVLQADAETIRQAYEARVKIDDLLIKREEAYRQIEALELQVEELVGEEGAFVYPAPPVPVAGFAKPTPASRPAAPSPKSPPKPTEVIEKKEVENDEVKEPEVVPTETETPAETEMDGTEENGPEPKKKK